MVPRPSPGFPPLSGTVGTEPLPLAVTPGLHPAPPLPDRKDMMHLLLLIIYLFGETEMM